jgi:hypothetical protein
VASLLPEEFWVEARQAVAAVKPGVLWLAESVHAAFVEYRRREGLSAISDSEVYSGFDLTYVYDIWPIWQAAVNGRVAVSRYLEMLRFQDAIYPGNYAKMRYVENHDNDRIMGAAPSRDQALAWTAFEAFNRGAFLIYGGQESEAAHTPSLFDIDKVEWKDYSLAPFLTRLAKLKKDPAQVNGKFIITAAEPAIQAVWLHEGSNLFGVFNVSRNSGTLKMILPDGEYENLLGGEKITVKNGETAIPATAFILRVPGKLERVSPLKSELLDFSIS